MRRPGATRVVIGLAALLCGCGGGRSADEVLNATASGMGKIRTADLSLRLVLEPTENAESGRVGFALRGPVDLDAGALPAARLDYTQIAGDKQGGATFVSTGEEAFVEVGGIAYRLDTAQSQSLREGAAAARENVRLPVDTWIREAEVEDGGRVGGVETDHVHATLDAAAALRDIFSAMRSAGADAPALQGAAADDLRTAVDVATIDVWSGRDDDLLRRLRLRIGFRVQTPAALRDRLGELAGGRLAFDLDLARVNAPVRVQPPSHPRPASELSGDRP